MADNLTNDLVLEHLKQIQEKLAEHDERFAEVIRRISGFIAATLWMSATSFAHAESDRWAGLYQGIDPRDGSINFMSLTPTEDGQYALHVSVTEHVKCGSAATITANAYIRNEQLVREQTQLGCADVELVDHSDTEYSLDTVNGIITLTAPFDGRVIHYHRISQ